ncbi:ankyrin repeat-containing protein [Plakobranchus ocellatus]|uniref:Ankyrin repeat-containing protein n=1 Tax=Plakobranchus ocellatus TaxID=259542 RepID=A0AAV4DMQ2_9GAST|nr:ankyrin repeat-containing protein [Plakobranchus ocellatus]
MAEQKVGQGCTELMLAVINQDVDYVHALVESGAELETRDKAGQNALYYALPEIFSSASLEILKCLVDKGININASLDGDGCSALVTAVVMDLPEVVQILVDNGADVDEGAASKFWGSLSSDPACQNNMVEQSTATTQFIFSKGCGHSITPLVGAVMFQRHKIFRILLKSGASPEGLSFGTFWKASMSSVCSNCDIEVTPLHMAAYIGDLECTYVLLNTSATCTSDVTEICLSNNCSSSFNDISPLWFALLQGHIKIVKLFLSLGKPIALPCHFGSGLHVCLEEGHTAIALMILRAGYDLADDMDWIEDQKFPTTNTEVIERIEGMVWQPRPLLDWCGTSLRKKFGFQLNDYLSAVEAPRKVFDILNFNDLSPASWQPDIKQFLSKQDELKDLENKKNGCPPLSHARYFLP